MGAGGDSGTGVLPFRGNQIGYRGTRSDQQCSTDEDRGGKKWEKALDTPSIQRRQSLGLSFGAEFRWRVPKGASNRVKRCSALIADNGVCPIEAWTTLKCRDFSKSTLGCWMETGLRDYRGWVGTPEEVGRNRGFNSSTKNRERKPDFSKCVNVFFQDWRFRGRPLPERWRQKSTKNERNNNHLILDEIGYRTILWISNLDCIRAFWAQLSKIKRSHYIIVRATCIFFKWTRGKGKWMFFFFCPKNCSWKKINGDPNVVHLFSIFLLLSGAHCIAL